MIRVLQVLGSLQRGGAETMIMNVYRKIDKNSIQFDFLLKEHVANGYEDEVRKYGGNIFYVESAKKIGVFKYVKKLICVMKNNGKYDIIHSHVNTLSGIILFAAKIAGINVRISHSHTTKQKNIILKKMISRYATNRIACGEDAGKKLFGFKKFTIIPNGIDLSKFLSSRDKIMQIKSKLNLSNNVLNICHIGRFVSVKNHQFIIELAEYLNNASISFKLYLIGDGPLLYDIQKLVLEKELEDKIIFLGSISNANEYLMACDLFILPSHYEGLPVTLIEAQCSGIHSIVSEHISKESDLGLNLVKFLPLDLKYWYNDICTLKNNHEVMSDEIKQKFIEKKYDINISSKMLIDYYLSAIKSRKGVKK